jgi:hypothetical protein
VRTHKRERIGELPIRSDSNNSPSQGRKSFIILCVLAGSAARSLSNNITQRSSAVKDFV